MSLSVHILSEIQKSHIRSGLSYKISTLEVIQTFPLEYSLILIVISHEIKLAFFEMVSVYMYYSVHEKKT